MYRERILVAWGVAPRYQDFAPSGLAEYKKNIQTYLK
jgi:hypothetical protein